jgi:hypothetical protein
MQRTIVRTRRRLFFLAACALGAALPLLSSRAEPGSSGHDVDIRAVLADPAVRQFVGLSENAFDFNAPEGVPGFAPWPASGGVPPPWQLTAEEEVPPGLVPSAGSTIATTSVDRPPCPAVSRRPSC